MYDYMAFLKIEAPADELEAARKAILDFKTKIPGIDYVSVGINNRIDQEYNWGVYIRFESADAREAYKTDPTHKALGEKYGQYVQGAIKFVEFEVS